MRQPNGFVFASLITIALATGVLLESRIFAQTRGAGTQSFDVVSVKPFQDDPTRANLSMSRSGGRIRWITTPSGLVLYAYGVQAFQVTGMAHVPYIFYVIDAETHPDASDGEIRLMFQSLLADRFKFQAHRETRQMPGYALRPVKGGVKIKAVASDDPLAPWPPWYRTVSEAKSKAMDGKIVAGAEGVGISGITARRVTMTQFLDILQDRVLHAPVVDQSGLAGQYYFAFRFLDLNAQTEAESSTPTLFEALKESLGLGLEKQSVPIEMLVVDHMAKAPTAN